MSDFRTATVTWTGTDNNFRATLGSGFDFAVSGSAGPDNGGSPMELLLAGVAGCTAIDVLHILRKKRLDVQDIAVDIRATRAEDHPRVYTEAWLTYRVKGSNISPTDVERAIELSKTKYCSASIMFKQAGVIMHTAYEIAEN